MARGGHMRKELPEIDMVTWSDLGVLIVVCIETLLTIAASDLYTLATATACVHGSGCAIHRPAHVV
jgi:hypothetical protein